MGDNNSASLIEFNTRGVLRKVPGTPMLILAKNCIIACQLVSLTPFSLSTKMYSTLPKDQYSDYITTTMITSHLSLAIPPLQTEKVQFASPN